MHEMDNLTLGLIHHNQRSQES